MNITRARSVLFGAGCLVVSLLNACDGDAFNNGASGESETGNTILKFDVTGTSEKGDLVNIEASDATAAEVKVDYRLRSSNPFRLQLSLSDDNVFDAQDTIVFNEYCGRDEEEYSCDFSSLLNCRYTTEFEFSCDEDDINAVNISQFIDRTNELNEDETAYLLMQVCRIDNGLLTGTCTAVAQEVDFIHLL